jgi:hypothetical protein
MHCQLILPPTTKVGDGGVHKMLCYEQVSVNSEQQWTWVMSKVPWAWNNIFNKFHTC